MKKKKNVLRKDFLMEIRGSLGRFLSIMCIVALGTSLFVGLTATEPDMISSGDTYADESRLMDIKVVSTYGLTEDDLASIERLPSIEAAEGSYSVDVLSRVGENMEVLHVMSDLEEMNQVAVTEGRLPKNENECLIDEVFLAATDYKIGDVVKLHSGTDAELSDSLKTDEFKIVGTGNSPLYFGEARGSSTIGKGTVAGFLVVQPEAFAMDVYTEVFAAVKNAEDAVAYTQEYEILLEDALEHLQLIQDVRCEIRRDNLAEEAMLQINDARNELNEKKKEAEELLQENEDKLDAASLELEMGKLQIDMGKIGIESGKAQIESGKAQIEAGKAELETGKEELAKYKEIYQQVMNPLKEEKAHMESELAELENSLSELMPEQQENVQASITALKDAIGELEGEITKVTSEFEAEMSAGEQQILDAEKLLKEKEAELAAAEKEIKASEHQLKTSESQISAGRHEIEDGRADLNDARQEMEEQIAEGEAEIADAEKEIADLELPVWYIFDRSSIPEYESFGDNAARIGALSIVFPGMFFLVAALISLTTMTRMVEEQRVQIGTLKALGFSDFAIVKKYLYYALAATLSGSLAGVLIGEKLFPYVIILAYKITVYKHLPYILIPYRWGYAIIATLIAAACTGGATILSCYKELLSQAAILMRPEPPKVGKRTLIERIPFVWKHLNFTWKSSLRNLFRYKKRFFMTLFGIGSCMGLLMVGFGLRDSITCIADYQYGELQLYGSSVYLSDDMEKEQRDEIESFLDSHKKISHYTNAHMSNLSLANDEEEIDGYLMVLEDLTEIDEFFIYRDRRTKARYTLNDDGVILTEKAAKLLGVKAGDQIIISEEGRNEQKVRVAAVSENYAGHFLYMTSSYYKELYEEEAFYNNILIKVKDGVTDDELGRIGEEILEFEDILNVQYTKDQSAQLNGMIVALDKIMILLIIVAGMLSFVVLYNLNNINITERRRELATLKVLGFYNKEVAKYVYRENVLLTFLGVLVGCVAGRLLHYFTIITVEVDVAMFGREVSLFSYGICALFTIGFSVLVNGMMYFKLKKIDMVESLKSVE